MLVVGVPRKEAADVDVLAKDPLRWLRELVLAAGYQHNGSSVGSLDCLTVDLLIPLPIYPRSASVVVATEDWGA